MISRRRRDAVSAHPVTSRRWLVFLLATLSAFAPMAVWAVASPMSSIPDEPAHIIRAAAVVDGQVITEAFPDNPAFAGVTVPQYVAWTNALTCFAFQPEVTADCAPTVQGDPDEPVLTATSAALNSPVFYAIVGTPSLVLSGDAALYGMRLMNALVTALLFGVAAMQLSRIPGTRWASLGLIIGVTPMVAYLAGSVNPNAWEATGTAALFATLLAALTGDASRRERIEQVGLVAVSTALLLNTRSIAFLWVVLVVVAVLVIAGRQRIAHAFGHREAWWAVVAAALVALPSLAWFFVLPDYDEGAIPVATVSAAGALILMVTSAFEQATGLIGVLGWLDTPLPAISLAFATTVIIGMLAAALVAGRGRRRILAALTGLSVLVVPAIVQTAIAPELGIIWQGRYSLALLVLALLCAGAAIDARWRGGHHDLARSTVVVTLVLLAIAHLAAFAQGLRRYSVGLSGLWQDVVRAPAWQPPGGVIGLSALFTLTVVVAVVAAYRHVMAAGPVLAESAPSLTQPTANLANDQRRTAVLEVEGDEPEIVSKA